MPPSRLPVRRAPVRLIIAVSLAVLLLVVATARDDADGASPQATRLTVEHAPQPPVTPSTLPAPPTTLSTLDAALARLADEARWVAAAPPPTAVPASSSGTAEASLVDEDASVVATGDASPSAEPAGSGDALGAIAAHFGDVYDSAVRVADCESSLDPGSVSDGGGNWGLFQINTVHRADFEAFTGRPWSAVLEADANAAYARKLYDGHGGWGPWECRWAA